MTGVPDNGNDWRKFRIIPRSHPCVPLFCTFFNRGGDRRAFRLPGGRGIISIVRWNLRLVIFGAEGMGCQGYNYLRHVKFVVVFGGIFGGSLQETLQNKNNPQKVKNNLKRFSLCPEGLERHLDDPCSVRRPFLALIKGDSWCRPQSDLTVTPKRLLGHFFAGVLSANTIRGNTTRNSERKMGSERVSERAFEKPLKTSEDLSKPLKTSETLPLRDPLRDPLRGRFPSQNLSVLLPPIVLPLETPTTFESLLAHFSHL